MPSNSADASDDRRENALPDAIEINPAKRIFGRVRPPGSKSITNRAVVMTALANGHSKLRGALDSEDTQVMIEGWRRLGVSIEHESVRSEIEVCGCSGHIPATAADLFLANSGTSMRFLSAAVALGQGQYRLDGIPRMRERPIESLLIALRALGADVRSELGTGCPPILVRATGLRGGRVKIPGTESSQFISALLMAAPYARSDVGLEVTGVMVSEPFVHMTVRMQQDFGVRVYQTGPGEFIVPFGQRYSARTYDIEPDATAASYFWAAAAITGGHVTVDGLGSNSTQGDLAFLDLLEQMGSKVLRRDNSITVTGKVERGIVADMRAISDTALTLAIVAAHAKGPTRIHNVGHIRAQETDRIRAMFAELSKVGVRVEEYADGLTIHPAPLRGAAIETYNDHRIAMSFALIGLTTPGIVLKNPACTHKTYPRFFEDLASLTGKGLENA